MMQGGTMTNINRILRTIGLTPIVILSCALIFGHSIQAIEHPIEEAEKLIHNGDYATAWRLLYDRMGPSERGKAVARALDQLEWDLLHDDRSALMQYLRDPEQAIQQKEHIVSEIVKALKEDRSIQNIFFEDEHDPFVRIMLSSQLPSDEKIELIVRLDAFVKRHYISSEQQVNLREHVDHLQSLAREQLERGQYRKAFTTIINADSIANTLSYFEHDLMEVIWEAVELFFQYDTQPLTALLRDPEASFLDKRAILVELEVLLRRPDAFQEISIQGQSYEGSFIDILKEAGYKTGSLIWIGLKDLLEEEATYLGSDISLELAQTAFPDYEYQPVFPQGVLFHSLEKHYRRDSVEVILQGMLPQKHLKELYSSLGFKPEMFTSQLKYANRSLLSQDWDVTLQNVQFARLRIPATQEKVWGTIVFAYQESQSGAIQFFISYFTS